MLLQEVEMITFRKYEEITDAELTKDPLIILTCGHAFLTSTLDRIVGLADFYDRDRNWRFVSLCD